VDYKQEFYRLLDAARQVVDATNFTERHVYSFAALQVLKNAVDYYGESPQQVVPADGPKWWCCSADFGEHDENCPNYNK
jgi:hypothetical protein